MKKIGFGKLAGICFALVFVSAIAAAMMGEGSTGYGVMYAVGVVCMFGAVVLFVLHRRSTKEQRETAVAQKKVRREEAKHLAKERQKVEMQKKRDDQRPVSAVLISTTTHRSAVSTVGRAVVGGAILGPVGAIGGAASGKSSATHATFSVKYASGRTGTETVEIHSKRFKELSALLHK